MAQQKTRVRVMGRLYLYAAPLGTPAPTDETVALDTDFIELGYTTEDSSEFSYEPDMDAMRAHQSDYPVRRIFKGADANIKTELMEWSGLNFQRVLGGGLLTTPSTGHFKYTPPAAGPDEITLVCDVVDGALKYRWVCPSVSPTDSITIPLHKTEGAILPITWAINGSDSGDPWYLLTNDTAFTPAA